ncbi:hypothetical protein ACH5RR_014911 [Cinchona calisaya]|uniref:Gnk2-homologous domain-containing protein n=1 Tax=Cinchona calisaya TaxID=153742 RepID=A0ABD2ZV79_9GENT
MTVEPGRDRGDLHYSDKPEAVAIAIEMAVARDDSGGTRRVYGPFMCRGDVNTDACAECVANAIREIVQ